MGDKATAIQCAVRAGVPTPPGSGGIVNDEGEALRIARKIGFPVLIKATAGGGGKGMRIAQNEEEFPSLMKMAKAEAQAAFGNPDVYIEKFIVKPKHVEIQILADNFGNTVYLGERDCSVQRRNQKLIEEAPCAALDEKTRRKMGESAVKLAKAVNYRGAGTIEFLLDIHGRFYFMEMNTRVQVEHPITEMVTGVDILKKQIAVASGEKLGLNQKDIRLTGHSIEFRINAEDPDKNFMPSPGKIGLYLPPGGSGVRVDGFVYSGYRVLPNYDSLIAKLIVCGADRAEAIAKGKRALAEFVVEGVKTTIPFHQKVLDIPSFQKGEVYTDFIPSHMGS